MNRKEIFVIVTSVLFTLFMINIAINPSRLCPDMNEYTAQRLNLSSVWNEPILILEHLLGTFSISLFFFSFIYLFFTYLFNVKSKDFIWLAILLGFILSSIIPIHHEIIFTQTIVWRQFIFDVLGLFYYLIYICYVFLLN